MTAPVLPLAIPLNLATHGCGLFPMHTVAKIPSYNASHLIPGRRRTRKTRLHPNDAGQLRVKLLSGRATT